MTTQRTYQGLPSRPVRPKGLAGVEAVVAAPGQELETVYYDTADLRLLAHGGTLRRADAWRLTLPGSGGEVTLPASTGLPEELADRVRAYLRGAELRPVLRLRTHRTRSLLLDGDGGTLAELDQDEVVAQPLTPGGRGRLAGWSQTGLVLTDGDPALLDAVERRLRKRGLRPQDEPPPPLGLLPARAGAGSREPRPGTAGAALTAYLRTQTAALLALDGAVRRDEPDSVHRMRVAARRLRSALAACRRLLRTRFRDRIDALGEELRRLGRVLGEARDAETTGARLVAQARALPPAAGPEQLAVWLAEWSAARYRRAHQEALRFLDGDGYFSLLAELERLAARPPLRARAGGGPAVLTALLRREQRRTARRLRAARRLPEGPRRDEALHAARKAAKRARYTAELAGAGRLAKRMRALQEALGGYQDAMVAERLLPELAARARSAGQDGFGYGVLYAAQRAQAATDLVAAHRAWRSARRRRLTRVK